MAAGLPLASVTTSAEHAAPVPPFAAGQTRSWDFACAAEAVATSATSAAAPTAAPFWMRRLKTPSLPPCGIEVARTVRIGKMRECSSASRIRTVGRLVVMEQTTLPSPFGPIRLRADAAGLRELAFVEHAEPSGTPPSGLLAEATDQLEAYFAGERTAFELPLAPVGTPFHERVWALVSAIGHGETATYGELAAQLGARPPPAPSARRTDATRSRS